MNNTLKVIKKKIISDVITPVMVCNAFNSEKYVFLLESVERGKTGRYSFIGFNPKKIFELNNDAVIIKEKNSDDEYEIVDRVETQDPLGYIGKIQKENYLDNKGLPPFCGGLVGYLGYEIISTWEKLEFNGKAPYDIPLGTFLYTDELIVFDHIYSTAEIIKIIPNDSDEKTANEAENRLDDIIRILKDLKHPIKTLSIENKNSTDFKSNFSKKEFMKSVERIKEDIFSGEIIQGVFSQRFEIPLTGDPFEYYRALRVINPSPYMFYLKMDKLVISGSSPEVMVKVLGNQALLRPIAGTRPRGKSRDEEKELINDLLSDEKEKAEHIMLVDLGRNDLGKVCKYGSVIVKELMVVEKYSHVMHMVSDIVGDIKDSVNNVDVFKACFPAGTVSGAPKIRAIEIIKREENQIRGPYAGSVGYFSFSGEMDMGITIRTMVINDDKVFIQTGAGIVADSVPEKEYIETVNKAKAMLEAVRIAKGVQ